MSTHQLNSQPETNLLISSNLKVMTTLISFGLHQKKYMDPIFLYITLVQIKSQNMEEDLISFPNKSQFLAQILEITSIKLSMMQKPQLKKFTIILMTFSKRLKQLIQKLKLFKSTVNILEAHGLKSILIFLKDQKLSKKEFITLHITNLWFLILKLQHQLLHFGSMSSIFQNIWITKSWMFLFMQKVHLMKCWQ